MMLTICRLSRPYKDLDLTRFCMVPLSKATILSDGSLYIFPSLWGFKDIELSLMKDIFLIIPLFRALYSCTKQGGVLEHDKYVRALSIAVTTLQHKLQ